MRERLDNEYWMSEIVDQWSIYEVMGSIMTSSCVVRLKISGYKFSRVLENVFRGLHCG